MRGLTTAHSLVQHISYHSLILWCCVSPVHVVFHISPAALGWFILLRGHVDHSASHLCRLGP